MHQWNCLLELKLTLIKNAFNKLRKKSPLEFIVLCFFFAVLASALFFFFLFGFKFFEKQEPFGRILVDETFFLFNFGLFVMLLISSAVSVYNSLFKSGEVQFLLTRPLQWQEVFFTKLAEGIWQSSWALLFISLPFLSAYGIVKEAPLYFPLLCLLFFIPFIILTGTLGTGLTIFVVWLLPNKRRRRIAIILSVLTVIMAFFQIQPEIVKEQGSLAGVLSGYLPHVAFAKNPLLPSAWITQGIIGFTRTDAYSLTEGRFFFKLILANALFFFIPAYSIATRIYPRVYLLMQDHNNRYAPKQAERKAWIEGIIDKMKWPPRQVMAFIEKDVKTFLRDPAEWSQMAIFFGILLLYFSNLKNLQFNVLKEFWKNIIFGLNSVGTYIVLSSFSMRFIFPMISLEGNRFWMINLSPIRFSQLLLEKFVLGTFISSLFTIPLIFLSGWMLEIDNARILYTTALGFFVCVALTGLSVGFGAKFPNFKSTNPSEIISGFGGSILLISHLSYLGCIGLYLVFSKEAHWVMFGFVAMLSLLIGMMPIKFGINALKKMEF